MGLLRTEAPFPPFLLSGRLLAETLVPEFVWGAGEHIDESCAWGTLCPTPDGPLRLAQAWRMVVTKWPRHPASFPLSWRWFLESERPGLESSLYYYLAV